MSPLYEDEEQDLRDNEAQEKLWPRLPAPVVLPENVTASDIEVVPENKPADDAVLEAEPAADVVPQKDLDAAEEAAESVIDNAKESLVNAKTVLGRTPSHDQWKNRKWKRSDVGQRGVQPQGYHDQIPRATEARSGLSQ